MTDRGEVSVKQNSHIHAVDAPALDDELRVDLDGPEPVVHAPAGVVVRHDDRPDEGDEEARTDGGVSTTRTDVEMRGQGVGGELAQWSSLAAALLLVASGYAFTLSNMVGIVGVAAGGLLGYIGTRSYWGSA